jgi:hypothetical protein
MCVISRQIRASRALFGAVYPLGGSDESKFDLKVAKATYSLPTFNFMVKVTGPSLFFLVYE